MPLCVRGRSGCWSGGWIMNLYYSVIRRESPLRLVLVLTTSSVVQTEFSARPIIYEWKQLQVYKKLAIKWKTVKHTRKTTNIKEKLILPKKIEVWRHKNLNLWNYGIRKKAPLAKISPLMLVGGEMYALLCPGDSKQILLMLLQVPEISLTLF